MKKLSIEDIFLSALGSDKRLKWYLQYQIGLVNYLERAWPQWIAAVDIMLALIPKIKRREMIGEISVQRIFKILEKERPDLYKTLNNEKGIEWMKRQIRGFEERFL